MEAAKQALSEGRITAPAFQELLEAYDKLYRQFSKMVNINDQRQAESREIKAKLEEELEHRKKAEKQLQSHEAELKQAKEQAERALAERAMFFASMSHEMRTPLAGVVGCATHLLHTEVTQDQKDFLGTILTSSNILMRLINDLLDFSKIEAGQLALESQPIDLEALLEEVIELVGVAATDKGLELIPKAQALPLVLGDQTRLVQVLVNLAYNAIKFTPKGQIELGADQVGEELRFWVKDTGVGIPQDQQKDLFSPFKQADNSVARRYGGTGLGLSICKKLVERFGGKIWFESHVQQGTVFCFTHPLQVAGPRPEPYSPKSLVGKRLLLLEPNPSLRGWLLGLCQRAGLMATGCAEVAQLQGLLAGSGNFQLLVIDKSALTGAGGEVVARTLSQIPQLPCLFLEQPQKGAATESGSAREQRLLKPIKSRPFLSALDQLTQGQVAPKASQMGRTLPNLASEFPFTVLVADDNEINLKVACSSLKLLGYGAAEATNGIEVMERLAERDFDLIFMDMEMPEMDGLEACRIIRQSWPSKVRPLIIGLSANSTPAHRQVCLEKGMDDFVTKPLPIEKLVQLLSSWGAKAKADPKFRFVALEVGNQPFEEFALIDLPFVQTLKTGYSVQLLENLVEIFQKEIEAAGPKLKALLEGGQTEELSSLAHKYKGSCFNLGILRLGKILSQIEGRAREKDLEPLPGLLESLVFNLPPTLGQISSAFLAPKD